MGILTKMLIILDNASLGTIQTISYIIYETVYAILI